MEIDVALDDFRDSVRQFCLREVGIDLVRKMDREDFVPTDLIQKMARQGYMGLGIPEDFEGSGAGVRELAVMAEELAFCSSAISGLVTATAVFGGLSISVNGTDEQRKTILPRIARGELLTAMGVTESDAGSDVSAIKTRAERTERGWQLTGSKMFTSGAYEGGLILVLARSGSGSRRHDGMSFFLVPNPSEGVTVRKLEKIGQRGISACEVVLDRAEVPGDAVLGGDEVAGSAWTQAMRTFEIERIVWAAMSLGIARRAFADALRYARERHQFGKPIGDFQSISHTLSDMATNIEVSRTMVSAVAERCAAGGKCSVEAAMTKLFVTERTREICINGMQILGGYGYLPEFDMERHLRDCLIGTIGAGTSQIQRNIIAKSLGLG